MSQHARALNWAKHELTMGISEHPLGSNHGAAVDHYQSFDFLPGSGYPWCVCFFLAAWAEGAGRPLPYKSPGAFDLYRWGVRNDWTGKPRAGDGVCFDVGSGHWGMFERFDGDLIVTIDGNTGNQVMRRRRPRKQVKGYFCVPEGSDTIVQVPRRRFVRVGSEFGHSVLASTWPWLPKLSLPL